MNISDLFLNHLYLIICVLLFALGFSGLLFHPNLLKKIIGMTIMDSAIFLFLVSSGFVRGRVSPILPDTEAEASALVFSNPIPSGMVLTGIVISTGMTAFLLALTQRLYQHYHSLELDQIMSMIQKGEE